MLFGLAGSGKGTQGKALADLYHWRWISNGEVIRRSQKYSAIINRGELIPDEDVINMMNEEIKKAHADGVDVILDGYPRDVNQAKYLMQHFSSQIKGAIIIDVSKEELYRRLKERGRADDQNLDSINQRFAVFEQNICPILSLLKSHHIPIEYVDGTGPVDTVTRRMVRSVQKLFKKGEHHD